MRTVKDHNLQDLGSQEVYVIWKHESQTEDKCSSYQYGTIPKIVRVTLPGDKS